jgi:hypothetical protein
MMGCALRTLHSVPPELVEQAHIPGMGHVRTWGDEVDDYFIESLGDAVRQYHAYLAAHPEQELPPTADILAISGGGDNGAYGAGLLCGWSERGDRPEFRLITGISTGALIAPLVFLGPEYDHVLREAYTTVTTKDVVKSRGRLAIFNRDGLFDTDPLFHLIEDWITDEAVQTIAVEHAKGRRLLVATVNLEAQRPVIWDLGAIASTGHPDAPELLRTTMLASASIPGAFEPQYIKVEAGNEQYEEMHVDGGAMAQVFLYGVGVDLNTIAQHSGIQVPRRPVQLFIIRNGRFHPEYQKMDALFGPIAGRAISTLIKTQAVGDMFRLYVRCHQEGMEFNLASIPPDFRAESEGMFDPKYMDALFRYGYDQAKLGYPWRKTPPYLQPTLGVPQAAAP